MKYFKLPDLGEGLQEAEIVEWHVKVGDTVKADQLLVSVETAKALVDIPAPYDGVVAKTFGGEGDILHVGEPLMGYEGEADAGTVVGRLEGGGSHQDDQFFVGAAPSTREHMSARATPAVRQLARQLGVELTGLSGSGPDGLITRSDVESASQTERDKFGGEKLRGVRRSMAQNMARSHAEVVPVTLYADADLHRWGRARDPLIRLAKAMAAACDVEPMLNCGFDGKSLSIKHHDTLNLGIAVDTPDGLFVPVLRDVGNRSSDDLKEGITRLRADVQARSIPAREMMGATLTLSNFGTMFGRYANPVVVPPQVAILAAGTIRDEPVAMDGKVLVHPVLPLSLTFDHRVVTGGEAARFFKVLVEALEQPDS
ncbi:dihydrolipoamide acetyltransferase family protein [Pseudomonas brassicacearum]|uniref:Dihydrolipoamide acetyltransferase component of pyruvate dehydrogenase complex n=1 Tax=Pseudomonas brassicacearum TaxID=930166 RepID=A0A423GRJ5_9PSED|nr:dihydrolipoamide acetyltransferase family protein [Pseudomonas brassicacearum]ROM97138.1 branched-chain alpha-keto acid dehydrogenase subunit E2 [Pseudomonas brassicacearum]